MNDYQRAQYNKDLQPARVIKTEKSGHDIPNMKVCNCNEVSWEDARLQWVSDISNIDDFSTWCAKKYKLVKF
jgi:hypothetical protein